MGLDPPETDSETTAGADDGDRNGVNDGQEAEGRQQQQQGRGVQTSSATTVATATAAAGGAGSVSGTGASSSSSSAVLNTSRSNDQGGQPVLLQLPRAHICFMQLLLPMGYKDVHEMSRALLVALQNVDYFGQT